jgi:hypothetical protein
LLQDVNKQEEDHDGNVRGIAGKDHEA